jgi:sialate O-acetylesterase
MKINLRIYVLIFILAVFFQKVCQAQISLPKIFGNDMVLQRDITIPVWGNAAPGTKVTAILGTAQVIAQANKEGKWVVRFPKFSAGGPYTLKVYETGKPDSAIELKGILIGDVWLASGQSNMELQVQQAQDAKNEIKHADYPNIHFIIVEQDKKLTPQTDIISGKWKICDSSSVKRLSAVAYYFARKIHQEQNVPIGIIQSTWGGTPIEAWTSREILLTSSITRTRTLGNDTLTPGHLKQDSLNSVRFWDIIYNPQNNTDKTIPLSNYNDFGWIDIEMPKVIKDSGIAPYEGIVWLRKKVTLPESFSGRDPILNLGHPEMIYSLYFNGAEICKNIWNANPAHYYTIPANMVKQGENIVSVRVAMLWGGGGLNPPAEDMYITDSISKISLAGKWLYKTNLESTPKIHYYSSYPAMLFNAMINPIIPYGIKGFLWYQGEANDWAAYNYRKLFPMLITDWRQRWNQGYLPFLYAQLPNYKKRKDIPSESEWAELREAQLLTLSLPNTGMACIIDIGEANDIHPTNKQEVGRRLALIADNLVYKKDCIAYGPMYKSFKTEGNRIRISFTNAGSGLSAKSGKEITGFAIAGSDKHFYWAKAIIEGNEMVVFSDNVPAPVAVRYAWADNPDCNLVNSEGLPAIPFRTDDWKGITQH